MNLESKETDNPADRIVSFRFANRKGMHTVEIPLDYFLELSPLRIH